MGAFPRVERYLARMPRGLDSHPECMIKASVFRVFTDSRSIRHFPWDEAPPPIAKLLRTPVPYTEWLPEVQVMATTLALADHHKLSDAETVRWFHEANASLLNNRMYRAFMSLASPSMLIRAAPRAWSMFHRGSGFGVVQDGHEAQVTLRFAPYLYCDLVQRGLGEAIKIALTMSRAKTIDVELVGATPRSCEYKLVWT